MSAARLTREYRSDGRPARASAVSRVLQHSQTVLSGTLLVVALGFAVTTIGLRLIPLAVTTGSMEPAMPTGSLIFVERVKPADVRVGDVITFDPPGTTGRVTHRVIARHRQGTRWYFETKGDANPAPDDWRRGLEKPDRYRREISYGGGLALRRVATIPYVGTLGTSPQLRVAVVLVPLALIALSLLRAIWRRPESAAA